MKVPFNHPLIYLYLIDELQTRWPNATIEPDTMPTAPSAKKIAAAKAKGIDLSEEAQSNQFICANYKIRIDKDHKYYLYFRNKHNKNVDGDFEFTEKSSFELRKKTEFYSVSKTKLHYKDIEGIKEFLANGDQESLKSAAAYVADLIANVITNDVNNK